MRTLFFFVLVVFGRILCSQSSSVTFDKVVADFGEVAHGKTVETTFTFTNVSTSSLHIKEVLPQCGCTSVDFTNEEVLTGAQGAVTLALHTAGKDGLERKTVTVLFSDETQEVLVLKVNVVR